MKFENFVSILFFLFYKISYYLVIGQTIEEKSDCTKLYNFLNGDSENYYNNCCSNTEIECDNEGYITFFNNNEANFEIQDITSFPYLSRIEHLQISNSNIKEIPNSILNLTSLKILILDANSVEAIPPAIKNLSKLETLYLQENVIKELPKELFSLTNLKELILFTNDIEVIPPAIKNLANLEELYLSENKIKELPNEIFSLKNIKLLDLGTNEIEIISLDIL